MQEKLGQDTAAPPAASPGRHASLVRRITFGIGIGLLVQYALGVAVNVYVTVPKRDHGGGTMAAFGRAVSNGPAALAVHTVFGVLLLLGTVNLVIRAFQTGNRLVAVLAAVTFLAILGAAFSGAGFVDSGRGSASLTMGLLTGLALLCSLITLFVLPPDPGSKA
jgi:hypothetical protein